MKIIDTVRLRMRRLIRGCGLSSSPKDSPQRAEVYPCPCSYAVRARRRAIELSHNLKIWSVGTTSPSRFYHRSHEMSEAAHNRLQDRLPLIPIPYPRSQGTTAHTSRFLPVEINLSTPHNECMYSRPRYSPPRDRVLTGSGRPYFPITMRMLRQGGTPDEQILQALCSFHLLPSQLT